MLCYKSDIDCLHAPCAKRRGDGLSFKQIIQTLDDVVDQKELTIFAIVGWGLVPITKSIYGLVAQVTGRGLEVKEDDEENSSKDLSKEKKKSKIRETYEDLTPWDDEELEESIHSIGEKYGPLSPFEDTILFHVGELRMI